MLAAGRTLVGSRQQLVQAGVILTNDVLARYNALSGGWREDSGDCHDLPSRTRGMDSVTGGVPR